MKMSSGIVPYKAFFYDNIYLFSLIICFLGEGCRPKQADIRALVQQKECIAKQSICLPKVDVLVDYPIKEFCIQDFGDVEYISFETNKDILLDGVSLGKICISDSLIVLRNKAGTFYVFDRKGLCLHYFNNRGRGPNQYVTINDWTFDTHNNEIYIYDNALLYRIWVYSLDGSFKRMLRINNLFTGSIWNYDQKFLLCYDERGMRLDDKELQREYPYFLLNKKTGNVIILPLKVMDRIAPEITEIVKKTDTYIETNIAGNKCSNITRCGDIYISDFACDTIFVLNNCELQPFMLKNRSLHKLKIPILFNISMKTSRYTFITTLKKQIDKHGAYPPMKEFVFDHKTRKIYEPHFVNKDHLSMKKCKFANYAVEVPRNHLRGWLFPMALKKSYEDGVLTGELERIASKLKEDDNPVLVLVKFKE